MKIIKSFKLFINENKHEDAALDNLQKAGDFNKLTEKDKLILLAPSGDIEKLKRIN